MSKIAYYFVVIFIFPLYLYASVILDVDSLQKELEHNPKDYKIHVLLSRYYFDAFRYKKSEAHIEKAKLLMPDKPEVIAMDKIVQRHKQRQILLKKYAIKDSDSQDVFFKTLQQLKEQKKFHEFEQLLEYYIFTHKEVGAKIFLLGTEAMLETEEFHKARILFDKSIALKETTPYLRAQAKLCSFESDFLCSAKAHELLYNRDKNKQELLLATQMYIKADSYAQASTIFKKLQKSSSTSKKYQDLDKKLREYEKEKISQTKKRYEKNPNLHNLILLSDTLHNYKQYKELKSLLKKHNKSDKSKKFYKYAGDISYWNADTNSALFYYTKIKNKDAELRYKIGRLYSWKADYAKALDELDKAQTLDNESLYYYDIYKARAYIWLWQGKYAQAAKVFKLLLNHTPDDKELQKSYTRACDYRDGKREVSSVKKEKKRVNYELQKAMQFYNKAQYIQSLGYFSYYLQKHSSDNIARENYAYALQKSAKHNEASQEYRHLYDAIKSMNFLHHTGYNLYKAKKFKEAQEVYKKILSSYGNNQLGKIDVHVIDKDILIEYALILEKRAQLKDAKLLYQTILHTYAQVAVLSEKYQKFLDSWLHSWRKRAIKAYTSHYTPRTDQWKKTKQQLFANTPYIDINITAPRIISTDAYKPEEKLTIRFLQKYSSHSLSDVGFKELDLTCNAIGCLIKAERWEKADLSSMQKYALERLKYISTHVLKKKKLKKKKVSQPKVSQPLVSAKKKIVGDPIGKSLKIELKRENELAIKERGKSKIIDEKRATHKSYYAGINARLFSDSDKRHYKSAMLNGGVKFKNNQAIHGAIGLFSLKEDFATHTDTIDGQTLMLEFASSSWTVGAIFDYYLDQMDISPYLIYNTSLKNHFINYLTLTHYLQVKFYKRNLFASKLSTLAMRQNIDKYALHVSDYLEFNRLSSLWFSAEMAYVSDDNYIFNLMFDYDMYKNHYKDLLYSFVLSGWYEHNEETKPQYYSPELDDVTQLISNIIYPIDKDINLKVQGGLGRNFKYSKNVFRYGLWLETPTNSKTSLKLGCLRSQILNNTMTTIDTLGYDFVDCKLDLQYNW